MNSENTKSTHNADYVVGFTGTREGMTLRQKAYVRDALNLLEPVEVHHGDCIGADAEFHALCKDSWPVVIHPPSDPKLRAFCGSQFDQAPEKPYLDRNRDIVDACDVLIATPKEEWEQSKGGTWYTIRYARQQGVKTIIVWPDGSALIDGCEHCEGRGWVPAEGHSIEHGSEPCPFCSDPDLNDGSV